MPQVRRTQWRERDYVKEEIREEVGYRDAPVCDQIDQNDLRMNEKEGWSEVRN